MARPPASEQVQVNFRMPVDLKARIEAAAEAHNRTTTAELVATLEDAYPAPMSIQDADELLDTALGYLDEWSQDVVISRLLERWKGNVYELIKDFPPSDDN